MDRKIMLGLGAVAALVGLVYIQRKSAATAADSATSAAAAVGQAWAPATWPDTPAPESVKPNSVTGPVHDAEQPQIMDLKPAILGPGTANPAATAATWGAGYTISGDGSSAYSQGLIHQSAEDAAAQQRAIEAAAAQQAAILAGSPFTVGR